MIPTIVYGFGEWTGWKEKELESRRDGRKAFRFASRRLIPLHPNVVHQLVLQTSKLFLCSKSTVTPEDRQAHTESVIRRVDGGYTEALLRLLSTNPHRLGHSSDGRLPLYL